jgi:hypothetical protein|mmetsp:Transcript_40727/g.53429  ORF Transcript_40727/g.53429 Transcript_40727/m.53429 type:complete len:93 (-) Transcript_40727:246-524(-)
MEVRQARAGHRTALILAKLLCKHVRGAESTCENRQMQTLLRNEIMRLRQPEIDLLKTGDLSEIKMQPEWYESLRHEVCKSGNKAAVYKKYFA